MVESQPQSVEDKIKKFEKFLTDNLEDEINNKLLVCMGEIEVVMIEEPYFNKFDNTATSKGVILFRKKQYLIRVTAYFSVNRIEIESKIFSITIRFDFGAEVEGDD